MATQHVATMYKNDGIVKRYSEGFKLKILAELSTGKYSKQQLGDIYGFNRTTINGWIRRYDRKDLMIRNDPNKGSSAGGQMSSTMTSASFAQGLRLLPLKMQLRFTTTKDSTNPWATKPQAWF